MDESPSRVRLPPTVSVSDTTSPAPLTITTLPATDDGEEMFRIDVVGMITMEALDRHTPSTQSNEADGAGRGQAMEGDDVDDDNVDDDEVDDADGDGISSHNLPASQISSTSA